VLRRGQTYRPFGAAVKRWFGYLHPSMGLH